MKRKMLVVWLILFTALALFGEEIALRKANDVQMDQFSFRTADNCEIVFWSDLDSGNRDIRCQKIGSQGQMVWDEPITLVSNPGDQRLVDVVPTSDNNFIILWEEFEIQQTTGIRVQKVTSNGMKLWNDDGIVVTDQMGYGDTHLVSNALGGAFVIYRTNYNTVYLGQNFDAFGNRLWQFDGINIAPDTSYQNLYDAFPDGAGGFVLNMGIHNGTQMVCNVLRFSAQGTQIGDGPLIPPNTIPGEQFRILPAGNGVFIAHNKNNDDTQVLYVNKFDVNGNLLLPQTVTYTVTGYDYFVNRNLAVTPEGGIVTLELMGFWNGTFALKMQKFSAAMVPLWGTEGIVVSEDCFDSFASSIKATTDGRIWVCWTGSYEDQFLRAQVFSSTGVPVWEIGGKLISNSYAVPITIPFTDRGVFIWNGTENGMKQVKMQCVGLNGALSYPPGGTAIHQALNRLCYQFGTFSLGDKYISLWTDYREDCAIYYQLTAPSGEALLEDGGIRLTPPGYGYETIISAKPTLDGKLALVYSKDFWTNEETIYSSFLQVIDENGQPVYPDMGIELDNYVSYVDQLYFDSNPDGLYLGWMKYNVGAVTQIIGQKIVDGTKVWGENGKVIASSPVINNLQIQGVAGDYFIWHIRNAEGDKSYVRALKVNENGDPETGWDAGGLELVHDVNFDTQNVQQYGAVGDDLVSFIILEKQGTYSARGQRVNSAGARLWQATGTNLSPEDGAVWVLDAVIGEESAILTLDDYSVSETTISFRRISPTGTLILNEDHVVIPSTNNCYDASLVKFANGSYLCAYSDNDGAWIQNRDAFMRFITPDGAPVGDMPVVLCGERYQQQYVSAAVIGNSALVTWSDDRAGIMNSEEAYTGIWGNLITSNYTAIDDPVENPLPVASLKSNYPNPFNPSTTISFELQQIGRASLAIYNLKGQLVKVLINDAELGAGAHNAVWDGTDASGRGVSSGVYFSRLTFGDKSFSRKMLLSK